MKTFCAFDKNEAKRLSSGKQSLIIIPIEPQPKFDPPKVQEVWSPPYMVGEIINVMQKVCDSHTIWGRKQYKEIVVGSLRIESVDPRKVNTITLEEIEDFGIEIINTGCSGECGVIAYEDFETAWHRRYPQHPYKTTYAWFIAVEKEDHNEISE